MCDVPFYAQTMNKDTVSSQHSFVVIEPDPVISLDLDGILKSEFPESKLTLFRGAEEAEKYLLSVASPLCIVVNSSAASAGLLSVLRDCTARMSKVVFIGPMGAVDFPSFTIQMPFTSEMILSTLDTLGPLRRL